MPSAPAPFVSFDQYLDANSGSLNTERTAGLNEAQSSIDHLGTLVDPAKQAAYGQGADAAKAAWSSERAAGNAPGGQKITSSEQYKAPTDFSVNFTSLPGYDEFNKGQGEVQTKLNTLASGGLGAGKTAFEAGMIGADTGYQDQAKQMASSFKDTVNGYLDSIKQAGQAGVASFKPAPIVTYQPEGDPRTAGTGAPGEGPVQKPHVIRRKYENGEPVPYPGEEQP